MSAHAAVRAHLVRQGVIRRRQLPPAKIETKDTINTTGDGAHKVTSWRYAQSALRDDSAAAGIVSPAIMDLIAGCYVKRPEKVCPGSLQGALKDEVFRQSGYYLPDFPAVKIRAEDQAHVRVVVGPVIVEQIDNFKDMLVQGRFAAQKADTLPLETLVEALFDEFSNGLYRHILAAGCLRTGAVAVEATQITAVGNIDFSIFTTGCKLTAETGDDKTLGPYILPGIQQQALQGDIAMSWW